MVKLYYDKDADLKNLKGKKVAIIGYASQGHAHANNLKDSGIDVIVAEAKGYPNWDKAKKAGFSVMTAADAAKQADVMMILLPDEYQVTSLKNEIAPNMKKGSLPGLRARLQYPLTSDRPAGGRGCLHGGAQRRRAIGPERVHEGQRRAEPIAVHQDASGKPKELALAYAKGIGGDPRRGSSRRPSRKRRRPTSSASRRCSAAGLQR